MCGVVGVYILGSKFFVFEGSFFVVCVILVFSLSLAFVFVFVFVLVRWARCKMVCALLLTGVRFWCGGVRSRNQGALGERCGFGGLGVRRTHARAGERGRA